MRIKKPKLYKKDLLFWCAIILVAAAGVLFSLTQVTHGSAKTGERLQVNKRYADLVKTTQEKSRKTFTKPGKDSPCKVKGAELFELNDKKGNFISCTHGFDPPSEMQVAAAIPGTPPTNSERIAYDWVKPILCQGDGQTGYRVATILLYDNPNEDLNKYMSMITYDVEQITEHYYTAGLQSGGLAVPRFATNPGCSLWIGAHQASAATQGDFNTTVNWLKSIGYNQPDRKYLVYTTAKSAVGNCGIGSLYQDDRKGPENANNLTTYAVVYGGCYGYAGSNAAVHELTHSMGAVLKGAPNDSGGFHCNDDFDPMCGEDGAPGVPYLRCAPTEEDRLDCGKDDYYNPAPAVGSWLYSHWSVVNNRFMAWYDSGPGIDYVPLVKTDIRVTRVKENGAPITSADGGAYGSQHCIYVSGGNPNAPKACQNGSTTNFNTRFDAGIGYSFKTYDPLLSLGNFSISQVWINGINRGGISGDTRLLTDIARIGSPIDIKVVYKDSTPATQTGQVRVRRFLNGQLVTSGELLNANLCLRNNLAIQVGCTGSGTAAAGDYTFSADTANNPYQLTNLATPSGYRLNTYKLYASTAVPPANGSAPTLGDTGFIVGNINLVSGATQNLDLLYTYPTSSATVSRLTDTGAVITSSTAGYSGVLNTDVCLKKANGTLIGCSGTVAPFPNPVAWTVDGDPSTRPLTLIVGTTPANYKLSSVIINSQVTSFTTVAGGYEVNNINVPAGTNITISLNYTTDPGTISVVRRDSAGVTLGGLQNNVCVYNKTNVAQGCAGSAAPFTNPVQWSVSTSSSMMPYRVTGAKPNDGWEAKSATVNGQAVTITKTSTGDLEFTNLNPAPAQTIQIIITYGTVTTTPPPPPPPPPATAAPAKVTIRRLDASNANQPLAAAAPSISGLCLRNQYGETIACSAANANLAAAYSFLDIPSGLNYVLYGIQPPTGMAVQKVMVGTATPVVNTFSGISSTTFNVPNSNEVIVDIYFVRVP